MDQLIKKCIKGDRRAQFDLYKQCYPFLMRVCQRYRISEDEAAAILNAGFLKILNNLSSYKTTAPFEAWAKRIMINTLIDDFRKNKKEKEHTFYAETPKLVALGKVMDYNEADRQFDANHIKKIIHKLPKMNKQVFNLYAIDGFTHKEIAEKMDFSEGTSKWYLSTARKLIKEMLTKAMEQEKKVVLGSIRNRKQ